MSKIQKRFIAGAVCPRCGEMDTIVMFKIDEQDVRECVSCDYTDKMEIDQETGLPPVNELDTRVNQVENAVREEDVQVIKFVPNLPDKK